MYDIRQNYTLYLVFYVGEMEIEWFMPRQQPVVLKSAYFSKYVLCVFLPVMYDEERMSGVSYIHEFALLLLLPLLFFFGETNLRQPRKVHPQHKIVRKQKSVFRARIHKWKSDTSKKGLAFSYVWHIRRQQTQTEVYC